MSIRKKILAFAMLLVVATQLFFFAGFLINQTLLQKKMKERLENTSLQTISLNKAAIKWVKKNKEVIIDGKLFDVKSLNNLNNQVIITGLFDEDEDELNKKLQDFIVQKNDESSPLSDLVVEFLSLPINTTSATFIVTPNWHYISNQYYKYSESIPVPPYLSETPPPKL